jgi:hypothetical protein
MLRYRLPYLLIPIAAFIIVFPLIGHGCSCGHDFDFHLINWFEAAHQFTRGILRPHWAVTPAWNAGEPRFVFYPPLSWIIGAILGLLIPWTWTPIAYTWLALTIAGIACFHAARAFAPPNAALLAATIYIANPYTLYTALERTAYAELLAAAWIPLLLCGILRDRVTIPGIAIPVALLWLTNAPAAVMSCYALALLTIVRLALSRSEPRARIALNTLAGTAIGLGLAAFYIVPAAYERRYVQIRYAILPGLLPWDNFLFRHTSDPEHDAVLRTASIVAVLLIIATAAALFFMRSNQRSSGASAIPHTYLPETTLVRVRLRLSILALAVAFMLTPLSTPLWKHLPEMRFLQFPWRLTAILAATFALALSLALSRLPLKLTTTITVSLLATLLLGFSAWHKFRQRCYPEDTVETRLDIFRSGNPGSEPTDEYAPIGADNEALKTTNPGYWLASGANDPAPESSTPAPAPSRFDLAAPTPTNLILNLRDYPAWQVSRNGSPVTTRLHREDGLIGIPLPAGPAHIEIIYTPLADQRIGYLITALSAFALALVLEPRRRLTAPHR